MVGRGVLVILGVFVGVAEGPGVGVFDGVGVLVGVAEGPGVGEYIGVGVLDGIGVLEGRGVFDGTGVLEGGIGVLVGVLVGTVREKAKVHSCGVPVGVSPAILKEMVHALDAALESELVTLDRC